MTSRARSVPQLDVPRVRFDLSCGARLVVSPRPGSPVTALRFHVRGARSFEPADRVGLAALAGGLVDQGTARHDDLELATLLEPAGGGVSGGPGGLSGSIAGDAWPLLLELACEMATQPTYPNHLVNLHKRRLQSRILSDADDPRVQAEQRFRRLVYGDHWMGRAQRGTVETIENVTRARLRAFHRDVWVPNRCTISVCGDVDPAKVKRRLQSLLSGWKPRERRPLPARAIPAPAVRVDAFMRPREQVHVYLGHIGIRRADPDYAALTVMDHILGSGPGFTNRITRRLRDELGLAYSVYADIHSSAGLVPGVFSAYIGTSPEHVGTAVNGFLEEIRLIRSRKVTRKELETARDYLIGSFAMGFERASSRAGYLTQAEIHGFPDDYLEQLPLQFAAVGIDDVRRAARAHLHPSACCLSAGGPVGRKELAALLG